ncbi:MAG: VOC family protein, partial [Aeromicrobium sp.]
MTTRLNPYLSFTGNAREAMDFYHSVFGGEVTRMTFADMPDVPSDPAEADKVMHSMLVTDGGIALMCADSPSGMGDPSPNSSVSLSGEDDAELRGYWEMLSGSGSVTVPLETAPWGDSFGMCVDKFGVPWMLN